MKQALWHLLNDLLLSILFLIVFAVSDSTRLAAGAALATGLVRLAWLKLASRRITPLQWAALGLLVILGGATLLTQDPCFVMVKPSLVHFAIAAAMLRRGWMSRYITPVARRNVSDATVAAAGYAWAMLMAALGLTNLIIALDFDLATWAWFTLVGSVGAKVAGLALQYAVFRTITRRRIAQSTI